jgi:hypothetical protein
VIVAESILAVSVAGPGSPEGWSKDDYGQEKEDAGDFKPEDAAYAAKGAQKAANAACDAPGCLSGRLTGGAALGGSAGSWAGGQVGGGHTRCGSTDGGFCIGSGALAGDAPDNAQANAQGAADGVRLHSVYDGSSDARRGAFSPFVAASLLPLNGDGSKVEESYAATRALFLRWPPPLEVPMTSRLRELIQQLGEAIHESVIESEQIAGVVQDIRKYGFDVLLMLEATIGLNEVAAKEDAEAVTVQGGEAASFTQNDLHFLHSLRIAVEGEAENAAESDTE